MTLRAENQARRTALLELFEEKWSKCEPDDRVAIIQQEDICELHMGGADGIRRLRDLRLAGDIRYEIKKPKEIGSDDVFRIRPGPRSPWGPNQGRIDPPEILAFNGRHGYCSVCRMLVWEDQSVHEDCPGEPPTPVREYLGYYSPHSMGHRFKPGLRQDFLMALVDRRVYSKRELWLRLNEVFPADTEKNKKAVTATANKLVADGKGRTMGKLVCCM